MLIKVLLSFAWALFLTVLIEEAAGIPLSRLLLKKSQTKEIAVALLLCNLITNPLINYLAYIFRLGSFSALIILLEVLVVLAETILLKLLTEVKMKQCLLLSLILNMLSYGIGLLI